MSPGTKRWYKRQQKVTCARKKPHESEWAAIGILQAMQASPRFERRKLHVYRCPVCEKFHIGSVPQRPMPHSQKDHSTRPR